MGLLTVFANFRIDSEERFLRMRDSFSSFRDADIEQWVINIRGPLKKEAGEFLRGQLGDRLKLFDLDSRNGWFSDSRAMLHEMKTDYVFIWVEDLICVSGPERFSRVVAEMKHLSAEYLMYVGFHDGDSLKSFDSLPTVEASEIVVADYDVKSHRRRMEFIKAKGLVCPIFIISLASIVSGDLFRRILQTVDPLLRRSPRETPFDFEKNQRDIHWLPLRVAQSKREFFAYVDDDHGRPNHSLIRRGLYPNRVSREMMLEIRESHLKRRGGLRERIVSMTREAINLVYSRFV